jgi:hypothetical protein
VAVNVKALLRRRGALVAAVTSLGVGAAFAAITALRQLLAIAMGSTPYWDGIAWSLLDYVLPVVVGVFLCLWLILPIDGSLELRFVVTRALVALIPAGVLLMIVQAVRTGVQLVTQSGRAVDGELVIVMLSSGFQQAVNGILTFAPFVLLAAIFQWHWLKHHPAKFEVAGMLDV